MNTIEEILNSQEDRVVLVDAKSFNNDEIMQGARLLPFTTRGGGFTESEGKLQIRVHFSELAGEIDLSQENEYILFISKEGKISNYKGFKVSMIAERFAYLVVNK